MEQETETETEMMHEERTTKTHTIGIAIRELENDLAHNKAYPRYDGERTDKVRITGGMFAPSLFITKSQCIKWMREHLNSTPSKQGKHWAKDGEMYVELRRGRYWVWVSCSEDRTRTEASQEAIDTVEAARTKAFEDVV